MKVSSIVMIVVGSTLASVAAYFMVGMLGVLLVLGLLAGVATTLFGISKIRSQKGNKLDV